MLFQKGPKISHTKKDIMDVIKKDLKQLNQNGYKGCDIKKGHQQKHKYIIQKELKIKYIIPKRTQSMSYKKRT